MQLYIRHPLELGMFMLQPPVQTWTWTWMLARSKIGSQGPSRRESSRLQSSSFYPTYSHQQDVSRDMT